MKLNKKICGKCLYNCGFGHWNKKCDKNWKRGFVFCPVNGDNNFMWSKHKLWDGCLYKMEQLVLGQNEVK